MNKKRVILFIDRDSIQLRLVDGAIADRQPLDPETAAGAWARQLRRSVPALKRNIDELNASGAVATVLYRSPAQSVDVASFAVKTAGDAADAARLEASDAVNFSSMAAVVRTAPLGRDADTETRQHHVLAAADRDDALEAIAELVEACDLKLDVIVPVDGPVMGAVIQRALEATKRGYGVLYVGERSSFFAVSSGGVLRFARRIGLGLTTLVTGLTRPIRAGSGDAIELTEQQARTIVETYGIPSGDGVVCTEPELTGWQVMPAMQSALQRFVVELRQTLRFGVDEAERQALSIEVVGPGAAVKGLPEVIASELEITVEASTSDASQDLSDPWDRGSELHLATSSPRLLRSIGLVPVRIANQRAATTLRRWLWSGAAAAACILFAESTRLGMQIEDREREAKALRSNIQDLEALAETSTRLQATLVSMTSLQQLVYEEAGLSTAWRATMAELAAVTPNEVRLSDMNFRRTNGAMIGTVSGTIVGSDTVLRSFVDDIASSAMFQNVELGLVRRDESSGGDVRQFDATFRLVQVPRQDVVTHVEEEGP